MQDDSEKLLKELHGAELEVTALRTELRKALEEAKRTRTEMHQFIEQLSRRTEISKPPRRMKRNLPQAPHSHRGMTP